LRRLHAVGVASAYSDFTIGAGTIPLPCASVPTYPLHARSFQEGRAVWSYLSVSPT
jgi:hypothetical protein